jgi:acetyl esterase/lipase
MSAEQREALEAILRQGSFPPDSDISEQRRLLRELVAGQPLPTDLTVTAATLGGVPVAEITIAGVESRHVVLYFHGGVYVLGDAFQAADLAAQVGRRTGARVFSVDYRLAPEHPFPAALDDVLAAFRWLGRRYPQAPVIVSGECAGGGLALSLALALRDSTGRDSTGRDSTGRDSDARLPAGIHVVSPFCDLALQADHLGPAADSDPWLNRIALVQLAACYIQDTDPGQPLVSPARADLSGLPPLLIQAAEPEALFPAAHRLASRARGAGVPVTFSPVADSVHSFILFDFLPETDRALAEFAAFTRNTVNAQASP